MFLWTTSILFLPRLAAHRTPTLRSRKATSRNSLDFREILFFFCSLFALSASCCISHFRNTFLSFSILVASCKVFPLFRSQLPHRLFPFYPYPSSSPRPSNLVSNTCLSFLLLSIHIGAQTIVVSSCRAF